MCFGLRDCQADHETMCVSVAKAAKVLQFDLGPDQRSPCGADADTRSAMLARAKHNRESEVRKKK